MFQPNPTVSPTSNPGYKRVYQPGKLTLGLFFPIEAYEGDMPTMANQVSLAQYADQAGFASLVFRDVPLRDPSFGDSGLVFDIWTYLGFLAGQTKEIALLTAAVVLPLRHPIHTAKAAASIDRLSNGRLILGVASGDRLVEFPAFGVDFDSRGQAFREKLELLKIYWEHQYPHVQSSFGQLFRADVIPKPLAVRPPVMVTGNSQQDLAWIAQHSDSWMTYFRPLEQQENTIKAWRTQVELATPGQYKPFTQSFILDLSEDPDESPTPIRLGYRLGRKALINYLASAKGIGIDHLAFIMKYNSRNATDVVQELAEFVVPQFR